MPELGGPGGPLAPPIFGRSVNPIPTGGGQIMPTISTGPPKVFHLPASLKGISWMSKKVDMIKENNLLIYFWNNFRCNKTKAGK